VEDADAARGDVVDAAARVEERRVAGEAQRDGVHREIAAAEIGVDVRGRDCWQRTGTRVGLVARGRDIEADAADGDAGGAESRVCGDLRVWQRGMHGSRCVALHNEIDVDDRALKEEVADDASHGVDVAVRRAASDDAPDRVERCVGKVREQIAAQAGG